MTNEVYISFPNAQNFFKISSDNPKLMKKIILYYGNLISNNSSFFDNVVELNYFSNLLTVSNSNKKFVMLRSESIDYVVSSILRYIRDNVLLTENYVLYHASCVKVEGQVYMFVGSSSSGKTTITAFLSTLPQAIVISEDITMINYVTCQVIPLYRPLLMRTDSYELLRRKYNLKFNITKAITYSGSDRIAIINTTKKTNQKFFLDKIIFLNLDKNKIDIKKCYGYEKLLINSYSNNNAYKNVCASLSISNKVSMYDLHFYDLENAYKIIKTTSKLGE